MGKNFVKNGLVIGVILLFIGASILPSIGGAVKNLVRKSTVSEMECELFVWADAAPGGNGSKEHPFP